MVPIATVNLSCMQATDKWNSRMGSVQFRQRFRSHDFQRRFERRRSRRERCRELSIERIENASLVPIDYASDTSIEKAKGRKYVVDILLGNGRIGSSPDAEKRRGLGGKTTGGFAAAKSKQPHNRCGFQPPRVRGRFCPRC
jgi:hypothetical protein